MIKKQSVPNLLLLIRFLFIPPIIWLYLHGGVYAMVALALYIIAALTDFFDGYLARKWNATSELGRCMDPIADKLLVASLLVTFISLGHAQLLPVLLILLRELFVSGLREYTEHKKQTIHVTKLAKWKTGTQMVAIAVIMKASCQCASSVDLTMAGDVLLWAAAILSVVTGFQYYKQVKF